MTRRKKKMEERKTTGEAIIGEEGIYRRSDGEKKKGRRGRRGRRKGMARVKRKR